MDKLDYLKTRVSALTESVRERDERIKTLEGKLALLEMEADKAEQYSRRSNFRFSGIPESHETQGQENTTEQLLTIITNDRCPESPVRKNQIERSHRLGPKMAKVANLCTHIPGS